MRGTEGGFAVFTNMGRASVALAMIAANALSPLDIEAMEVYHGMATVPPEFSPRPNDCAAIVVWTRWHGADK